MEGKLSALYELSCSIVHHWCLVGLLCDYFYFQNLLCNSIQSADTLHTTVVNGNTAGAKLISANVQVCKSALLPVHN